MPDDEYVAPDKQQLPAVTGRPNDIPVNDPEPAPLGGNSTFAERAKARSKDEKATAKQVASEDTEDKAVTSASTKTRARKK